MARPYEIRIKITGEGAPQVKMIKRDLEGVKRAAGGVDKKMAAANRQTRALGQNMKVAGSQARTMGANIKRAMGYFGIMAGGYMLVNQLKEASRAAIKLDSDLANVNSLLGKSHPMYGQYRKDVIALKREVPVLELHELTMGLYDTISAGIEAKGAMAANAAMAKAAAGGWAGLSTVVKGTTTVMNAYSLAGEEAIKATDYGLKTVEKGKLNYEDYAEGISMVAGTAATAKVDLKELHAAISIATRVQRPEQAFTGLRMAILSLTTRRKELRKMGIEWTNLADTIEQIKNKAPTDEEWAQIMPEMRGAETLKAIVLNYDDWVDVLEEFDDVSGTTMDKYNERLGTTEFRLARITAQSKILRVELGEKLTKAFLVAAEALAEFNKAEEAGREAREQELTPAEVAEAAAKEYGPESRVAKILAANPESYRAAVRGVPKGYVKVTTPAGGEALIRRTEAMTLTTPGGRRIEMKAIPPAGPEEEKRIRDPRRRGGVAAAWGGRREGTTVHIDKVEIKANKVDDKSFMRMMGKIVKEEAPAPFINW